MSGVPSAAGGGAASTTSAIGGSSRDLVGDPLANLKVVRRLTGLSGTDVYLCSEDSRHFFVRKVAVGARLVPRLREQAKKQARFAEQVQSVSVAKVIASGGDDNCFWFDMEYVQGLDGVSYLQRASYAEVQAFARRFDAYLREVSALPAALPSTDAKFFLSLYTKLCSIQDATGAIPADSLARLFLALQRLLPMDDLAPTLCHGDLTLENMIVTHDGQLIVLDLTPSPFEHYWHDIAKLHQDLAGGWYLRHNHMPIAQGVLDYLRRNLLASARAIHPGYELVHHLMTAIVFARILPYASDAGVHSLVLSRVEHFSRLAFDTETKTQAI